MLPFKLPLKSFDELSPFYKDYILKVSGEEKIENVKLEDANGFFQMIEDASANAEEMNEGFNDEHLGRI